MEKNTSKILGIISAIIIIVGAVICFTKGFNIELLYLNRQEILVSSSNELDTNKIEEIAESILENQKVKVQKIERFGNAAKIISEKISDEQKQNLIEKINEEMNLDISNDEVTIVDIPNSRIRDMIKPYILPGIISFASILLYFLVMYNKIGLGKVLLKGICVPVIVEAVYYAIILITRIPFGRITNSISIGLYVVSVVALTTYFQSEKEKIQENNKKEND